MRRAVMVVLLLLPAALAHAGNDDQVLLGNEAAMSGGAVSAVVRDGSAAWYNPAGIAAVTRDSLDLSGSATMLRVADTPGLLRSVSTGAQASGSYVEFLGIPSAVTLTRRLDPNTIFGLALFVPQLMSHTDRVALEDRIAEVPPFSPLYQLHESNSTTTYYGGVTIGRALAPNLRIGATLFGSYHQESVTSSLFTHNRLDDMTEAALSGRDSFRNMQSVSFDINVGLQWEITNEWRLGVALRSPGLMVASLYNETTTEFSASSDEITVRKEGRELLEPRADMTSPARLRVGLAYMGVLGWVGIDADVQHEVRRPEVGVDRDWIFGVRIGGRYIVDPNLSIGAGLFTDLDATRRMENLGDTAIDFFGGTVGMEIRSPHLLGEGEDAPNIIFVNTFGLRYALGVGKIGGYAFDSRTGAAPALAVVPVDTTVHEISLHLGSALLF